MLHSSTYCGPIAERHCLCHARALEGQGRPGDRLITRLLLLCFGLIISVIAASIPVAAQTAPDDWRAIARWQKTADAAQARLDLPLSRRDRFTTDSWEDIRLDLTVQREEALTLAQRGTLKGRIAGAQLAQLGESLEKGAVEPAWVKQKRDILNKEVALEEAPAIAARDIEARNGVLIREIDQILRQKRREKLFTHDHPIFRPATWASAIQDMRSGRIVLVDRESPRQPPPILTGIPLAFRLAMVATVGLLAIWLADGLRRRLRAAIDRRNNPSGSPRSRLGLAFARDILDIGLPAAALLLVLATISLLTADLPALVSLSGQIILACFTIIYARWLANSVCAPAFPAAQLVQCPNGRTVDAIRLITALGFAMAANQLVDYVDGQPGHSAAINALLSFAIVISTSFLLWRLARILKDAQGARSAAEHITSGNHGAARPNETVRPVARFISFAAGIAALAALTGYVALARYLMTSTLMSLATICTALFLYRSLTEAGALLLGHREGAGSRYLQLMPLAFGFLLFLLTLPIIAVMWGINAEQIIDALLALKNGIAVGRIRISFGNVMTFALVFLLGYALTRWLQRILHFAVLDRLRIEAGARAAILTGFGYIGLTLSAVVAITAAGLDLSSLAFIAGALSVGVGFGLQSVVANFVSGIILLIERPIKVGDWIEVGDFSGHVRRIAFRSTHIETFDRHEVIIPNSELISGSVTNLTYGDNLGRISLPVGIAYGSDVEAARRVLLAALAQHERVLKAPEPNVVLDSLGESAINLKALCFVENVNQRQSVRSDLYFAILKALEQADIAIPFPQREIWVHTDQGTKRTATLIGAATSPGDA